MNKQELIKHFEDLPYVSISQMGKKSFIDMIEQLDEPQPIKLKDVIKRIEKFDLGTKAVWINEILNKLGSDYGLHKYYAGYKQGKFDGAMEREKVIVPQFVADWIEACKENSAIGLYIAMNPDFVKQFNKNEELISWVRKINNQNLFVRAWLDGYTVEEEKRFTVVMKATKQPLYYNALDKKLFFSMGGLATSFTQKQLEKANFGWVFDCEGIEIEEVE